MSEQSLTTKDIQRGYEDHRWMGWGYLGGREYLSEGAVRDAADHAVLCYANAHGWDYDRLFTWMNSRPGRHFADDPFHKGAFSCLEADLT